LSGAKRRQETIIADQSITLTTNATFDFGRAIALNGAATTFLYPAVTSSITMRRNIAASSSVTRPSIRVEKASLHYELPKL
jgi:hypothetical protein